MGFMSGVITGVAVAAGGAAWYLSRSGSRFRDQYRVEHRLAELGDLMERRTRELQASMNAQLTEMRSKDGASDGSATSASAADSAGAANAGPTSIAASPSNASAARTASASPPSSSTTSNPKRASKPTDT